MKKASIQSSFEMDDDELSPVEKIQNFFRKPQAMVVGVLVCVILMMGLQFGKLQHQIDLMGRQVKTYHKQEVN